MHLLTWADFPPVSDRNYVPKPSGKMKSFPSSQSQTCCASWHRFVLYGGAHNASGFAHVPKHHVTDHAAIHHRARQHPDSQYSPLDLPADESHGQHHQSKPDHLEHSVGRHVLLMEKSHVVSLVRPHRAYDDFHGSIAV